MMRLTFLSVFLALLLSAVVLADPTGQRYVFKRQAQCPSNAGLCGGRCAPLDSQCCSQHSGTFCPAGSICVPDGCCPIGRNCFGPAGTMTLSGAGPVSSTGQGTNTQTSVMTSFYTSTTPASSISNAAPSPVSSSVSSPKSSSTSLISSSGPTPVGSSTTSTPKSPSTSPVSSSGPTTTSQSAVQATPNAALIGHPSDTGLYAAIVFGVVGHLLL